MKEKFTVTGMTCSACSAGIERTLNKMEGIVKAEVSLMGESMNVEYDETVVTREQIIAAVKGLATARLCSTLPSGKRRSPNRIRSNGVFSFP